MDSIKRNIIILKIRLELHAAALYERLKSINANAEISFINEFISVDNMPDTRKFNTGINASDYTNEAPQLFDESCFKTGIPVIHPCNVVWGGLFTVLSPNGSPLQLIEKSSNFNELDVVEYASSYQRYWQESQIWLKEVLINSEMKNSRYHRLSLLSDHGMSP